MWITVLLEGYDLVVLGAIIPTLLKTHHLGMTAGDATTIATLSLVGVAIGAVCVGPRPTGCQAAACSSARWCCSRSSPSCRWRTPSRCSPRSA